MNLRLEGVGHATSALVQVFAGEGDVLVAGQRGSRLAGHLEDAGRGQSDQVGLVLPGKSGRQGDPDRRAVGIVEIDEDAAIAHV